MISKIAYEAFRLEGEGIKLEGGQNNAYRFGDIVIKKNDGDNENYNHIASILNDLDSPYYRVAKPVISNNNKYVEGGYIATCYEEGYHNFDNISETLKLSKIFHRDLQRYDISLLKEVDNQWALAMDVLFRKRNIPDYVDTDNLEICLGMMNCLNEAGDKLQIIHGDFGGNILFHDSLPPCIIDFSPNIAPAEMADVITIVDLIAWENKDLNILKQLKPYKEYKNYLLYAVMFRLLATLFKKGSNREEFSSEYNAHIKAWNYVIDK